MFKRQRTGSVVCASCGSLVGVNDDVCYSCGRRNPGLWGFGRSLRELGNDLGFVQVVLWGCVALYLASLVLTLAIGEQLDMNSIFSLLGPNYRALLAFGASGAYPLFRMDRWWSLLSAGWLHGGVLHLVFNMMMLRELGPPTAEIYGAARMVIVYVAGGVAGFLASSIAGYLLPGVPFIGGGLMTVGASAPIFGLLGALMYYGRRGGSSLVRSAVMGYVMSAVIFGVLMSGRIDNWAHAGGYLGGYLAGRWLDPLKPERMDHMVIAVLCLLASGLAIIASLVTAAMNGFWA